MHSPLPLTRDLVLVGGGHAHALVLRRWGMARVPGVRLTVVNPDPTAPYTGMLPGHVAGHYPRAALEIDIVKLTRFAGGRLILDRATGIDRDARRVHLAGRPPIRYDVLSLDIGITSDMPGLKGFAEHGVAAKPLQRFADRWAAFQQKVGAGRLAPRIAVIGGGVAGAELAMAMAHRLKTLGHAAQVTVLEAGDTPLRGVGPRAASRVLGRLKDMGITLRPGALAVEVTADGVILENGETIPAALVVGAAGARPHDWLADTGLELHEGYISVGATLRSLSDPTIHAAGDCAHLSHAPRPKAGVYAVRAAPVLHHNLLADLTGRQRREFHPQRDFLRLISLGGKDAVADRSGLSVAGPAIWRLKDRIDRAFMRKLDDLPAMRRPPLPKLVARGVRKELAADQAPCAGCGAKVGGAQISAVLAALPHRTRTDIETGAGDDAAVLRFGDTRAVLSTDHLRAFTEDPWIMGRVAAIHALGDVWAMGAAPQAALATLVLPHMREGMQAATLAEIMDAATHVFTAAGAEIVGGHTTLGAELTVGFTVTGIAPARPILLSGARPGDRLILTKPIGTGTILAGDMMLKAQGPDVAAAWASMCRPQGDAAAILKDAHAMTDVTGFGLAGHLLAMLDASGVAARLDLGAVPVLPGAEALAAKGVRSTLYPANAAAASRMFWTEGPKAALLFDPQTAGGLLAAVPADRAADILGQLVEAGYEAARIGEIVEGAPFLDVTGA
ncbi:selenide, water dikinase SelD [Halovulum dunhuangense]|uniref:Selenide, water dikinase SelD n=1 Tax=Halovulum dunhuangense TaxID=1505036 RepID=A0A849L3Q9_9RHOB|nr:selenide, water dikinase SelD [Halovulum dunhuangense]NNU80844.1 selenide, water dikinase SelD [Halovulum dunhuangense]